MNLGVRFGDLADVLLPGGGWALTVTQAYIDESYRDKDPRILCVGGYLFRKTRANEFRRAWLPVLKANGLEYFHTNELAGALKPDSALYGKDIGAICRQLIKLTREKTAYGFAVTVNEDEYAEIVKPREAMPSAYTFALYACLGMVRQWKEEMRAAGPTAFFFEEGHKHEGEAGAFLNWIFEVPAIAQKYGYSGHDFVLKKTPQLHPADYLTWHWRLESARQRETPRSHPPRADLKALVRDTDMVRDYTRADLIRLEAALRRLEDSRRQTKAERAAAREAAIMGAFSSQARPS
jgi:hypothetical protein